MMTQSPLAEIQITHEFEHLVDPIESGREDDHARETGLVGEWGFHMIHLSSPPTR